MTTCAMPERSQWTIIGPARSRRGRRFVLAQCSCETEREVSYWNVVGGTSLSCGCTKVRPGGAPRIPVEQRLWAKVDKSEGCWTWTGRTNRYGYGRIWRDGKDLGVHRLAWELLVGPIPADMTIDHLCLNKVCVNPDHLEVVTRAENSRRNTEVQRARKEAS